MKLILRILEEIGSLWTRQYKPKEFNYNGIVIRPMKENELDEIFDLQMNCFNGKDKNRTIFLYKKFKNLFLVASNDDKIVGFHATKITPWFNGRIIKKAYLWGVCVHSNYRRKSIGERLVQSTMCLLGDYQVKEVYVNLESSNPSRKIFERCGFKFFKYLDNSHSNIRMKKKL